MTRKERAAVQGFINKLSELDKIAEASGIESLEYRRAEVVYERFIKASAQMDLIRAFGGELAEIGFWKN